MSKSDIEEGLSLGQNHQTAQDMDSSSDSDVREYRPDISRTVDNRQPETETVNIDDRLGVLLEDSGATVIDNDDHTRRGVVFPPHDPPHTQVDQLSDRMRSMNVPSTGEESASPSRTTIPQHDEKEEENIEQQNQEAGLNAYGGHPEHGQTDPARHAEVVAVLNRNSQPIRRLNMSVSAWVDTIEGTRSGSGSSDDVATNPSISTDSDSIPSSAGGLARAQTRAAAVKGIHTTRAEPDEFLEPIQEGRSLDTDGRAVQLLRITADNMSESDRSNNVGVPSVPSLVRSSEPTGQYEITPTFELQPIEDVHATENEVTFIDVSVHRSPIRRIVAITRYGVTANYDTSGHLESTRQLIECDDPSIRLTINDQGEHFVATDNQVHVFSPEYELLHMRQLNLTIRDIASDTNGKIYVLLIDGTVRAFQWIIHSFLRPIPTERGRLTNANSIAVHDSVVYLTNSEECQIVRCDLNTRANEVFVQDLARPEAVFVEEDTSHIFFCNGDQIRVYNQDRTSFGPRIELDGIARAVAAIGNSVLVVMRRGGVRVFSLRHSE